MKQNTNPDLAQVRTALENLQKWSRAQLGKPRALYPEIVNLALKEAADLAIETLASKSAGMQFSRADAKKIEKESDSALKFAMSHKRKSDGRLYWKTFGETLAKLAFFPHSFVAEYRDYERIPYNSSRS